MAEGKGCYHAQIATGAVAAAAAGGLLAVANPEGVDLIVTRILANVTDASDAAGTFDAGIAANGSTLSDNLLDGQDFNTVALLDNLEDHGTNGKMKKLWPAASYLTFSKASGGANAEKNLVIDVYVEYVRA